MRLDCENGAQLARVGQSFNPFCEPFSRPYIAFHFIASWMTYDGTRKHRALLSSRLALVLDLRPDNRASDGDGVRPYAKARKNDDRDAEGIAEAATRPTMRFVDLKSQDQLDVQTLHLSRDRLVGERTALTN